MSTKKTTYTAITAAGDDVGEFARKEAAVRAGEKVGEPFYVRTSGGAVVHDTRPAEDEEDEVTQSPEDPANDAGEDVQGPSKDVDGHVLNYREVGPKHFYRALTEPVLARFKGSSRGRNFTVTVPEAEVTKVVNAWDGALAALKEFKREDAAYKRASAKTSDGRKLRYELEQEHLSAFVKKALR